jgi:diguanylate cyclase (GGDEF)-like protein
VSDNGAPANLAEAVMLQRLTLYYDSLRTSLPAVVVNALVLVLVLWAQEKQAVLLAWVAATLLLVLLRAIGLWRFRRTASEDLDPVRLRREVILGSLMSGLCWGAGSYLLFDPQLGYGQLLLIVVVAGVCAGNIVSQAAFSEASMGFLPLALLPLALRLLLDPAEGSSVLALVILVFLGFMLVLAAQVSRTLLSGLEAGHLHARAERTIEHQALYDDLTGLPNRRLLRDRLQQAISHSRRHGHHAALLFLDLDFFKRVNDSLGHNVGDLLLVEVAERLRRLLRDEDTAARLGGDEFVALFTGVTGDRVQVVSLIRRRGEELLQAIEKPFHIRGNEIHISVSIGASVLTGDTDDVDDLLRHADTAMYKAKEEGRNTLRFFVDDMQQALVQRLAMERQLRAALDSGDGLELYLQPQYDRDMQICGAETLLRWQSDGEFIPPNVFIPMAEDCGLIYRLGDWVLQEACRIAAELRPLVEGRDFSLAINVSPRQFRQKGFPEKVFEALQARQLPPRLIDLELTEGVIIDDVEETVLRMRRLRDYGLRFSVDDFGTGYSSLRYLESLPIDTLKIDQSFVHDVLKDRDSASIVRLIITMAQSLELNVIAEGVESREVHDFLVDAGCHQFQGYLYSRPVDLVRFRDLLQD